MEATIALHPARILEANAVPIGDVGPGPRQISPLNPPGFPGELIVWEDGLHGKTKQIFTGGS
jgi:hypothetical protein